MAKNTLTTAFDQTEEALKHPIPVRAYKDRIFRMIFKEKRALLALYNAMNTPHIRIRKSWSSRHWKTPFILA